MQQVGKADRLDFFPQGGNFGFAHLAVGRLGPLGRWSTYADGLTNTNRTLPIERGGKLWNLYPFAVVTMAVCGGYKRLTAVPGFGAEPTRLFREWL